VEIADLIGGRVHLTISTQPKVRPHIESGKLRALAVTSLKPSALAPGLPTIAASGLPGYETLSVIGMFAPAKTPAAIVQRLNQESVRGLRKPEVKEKLFNAGVEGIGSSPEELAATLKSEQARASKLFKDAGVRLE
jgi:tripartite-type tricarboxylate transporter receptor subunit TctC